MSLNLVIFIYSIIFAGMCIYDFYNYTGNYLILNFCITGIFYFIIISSVIESYCKKESEKKK